MAHFAVLIVGVNCEVCSRWVLSTPCARVRISQEQKELLGRHMMGSVRREIEDRLCPSLRETETENLNEISSRSPLCVWKCHSSVTHSCGFMK